jgi:hypothetical protein
MPAAALSDKIPWRRQMRLEALGHDARARGFSRGICSIQGKNLLPRPGLCSA